MKKYFYPAIFHEENSSYWVEFPGLEGCLTQGETFEEAYKMATEALGLYLEVEENVFEYPKALTVDKANLDKNSCVVMVEFDEVEYLKKFGKQAVKKTLTIPQWLNVAAERENINFSQTLQNALIEQLSVVRNN